MQYAYAGGLNTKELSKLVQIMLVTNALTQFFTYHAWLMARLTFHLNSQLHFRVKEKTSKLISGTPDILSTYS